MSKSTMQQTDIAVKTHAFSEVRLGDFPEVVRCLLWIKQAALRANQLDVPQKTISALNQTIDHCLNHPAEWRESFVADVFQGGGAIAVHTNINEVLASKAKVDQDFRKHLTASQSTADVVASALRMAIWRESQVLLEILNTLAETINERSRFFAEHKMMARTCLQDAMPTRHSNFLDAWSSAVLRHQAHLGDSVDQLLHINLGGTVIGSTEGASDHYLQHILAELCALSGMRLEHRKNLYDAAQFSDDLFRVSADLESLSQVLIKMASDVRLLASGPQEGFGEWSIPKIIPGSSFFSAKNNPTIAETMMQCCWLHSGRHHSLTLAIGRAELNLNVFEPMMGFLLLQSIGDFKRCIHHFSEFCLKGLSLGSQSRHRSSGD